MKVLIVCNGVNNTTISFERSRPFIFEQMQELQKTGIDIDLFLIKGTGVFGYLRSRKLLMQKLSSGNFNLIHAHYGFSGMLAILQTKYPVVISFIGTDINVLSRRFVSWLAMFRSSFNIFVGKKLFDKAIFNRKSIVLPYGIDFSIIFPIDILQARKKLNIDLEVKLCLFGSSKNRKVKNYKLAKQAVELCNNVELIELTGQYTKEEMNLLINSSNCLLLTSFSEGSPQVIKEAMACNLPIVSTDVGDVRNVIGETAGCYLTSYDQYDVAENIKKAMAFGKTNGRNMVQHLDNKVIVSKLYSIYKQILT